jgi:triosephosphate isomerase
MAARIPLMAGNWKMNLDHTGAIALVQRLAWALSDAKHDYSKVEVAVIPPFTDLRSVQTLVNADKLELAYGAQDVSAEASGAFTGEVSATMLAALGCRYAVVGHSERRQYHAETDALIGAKAAAAFGYGVVPIICVGEALEIRRQGQQVPYTLAQVDGCFAGLSAELAARAVVAYEPVWAIGTGEVATPADAQEVCAAIRVRLAELYSAEVAETIRILYGGSVKSSNVAAIMAQADVDGALVGGASLDAEEFAKIVRYREHATGL